MASISARSQDSTTPSIQLPIDPEIPEIPDLPETVLVCILQHVPLHQRLACCALVCRTWAAAVAAVPVVWDLKSSQHCEQLQAWLDKYRGAFLGLTAKGDEWGSWKHWCPLQLPVLQLKQLHSLDLTRVKVQQKTHLPKQEATALSSPSRSSSLTRSSTISPADSCGSAAAATVLLQLQKLKLSRCQVSVQLIPLLLSASTLSALHWDYVQLFNDDFAERLTRGQVFSAMWQCLQLLPNLTKLQVRDKSLTTEDISPLSNLQHLRHLTLELSYCRDQHTAGARQLLSALGQLTHLRHLELNNCHLDCAGPQRLGDSYQSFRVLTASTQLTALILAERRGTPAINEIFAPRRKLPSLKVLCLVSRSSRSGCVGAAQVARLAASCPALQEVVLERVTVPDFDASCLLQLPPAVTSVEGLDWTRPSPEPL